MQPWEELDLGNWVPAIRDRKKSVIHKCNPLCYFLSGLLRPSQNVFKMPPQDPYLPLWPMILHRPKEERPAPAGHQNEDLPQTSGRRCSRLPGLWLYPGGLASCPCCRQHLPRPNLCPAELAARGEDWEAGTRFHGAGLFFSL